MTRFLGPLLVALVAGCIHGAPLPPVPASSQTTRPVAISKDLQDAACIRIAQTYLRGMGKDPMQAFYEVHRSSSADEELLPDEPTTIAVIDANFLDGTRSRLALKSNGDISLLAN